MMSSLKNSAGGVGVCLAKASRSREFPPTSYLFFQVFFLIFQIVVVKQDLEFD